jgi:hypothetical protein
VGNFKAVAGDDYQDYQDYKTWEVLDGKRVEMVCHFAVFSSLEAGLEAYLHAMYTRWTLAWTAAVKGDPRGFALGLHDQKPFPYYTADPAQYVAGVTRWYSYYLALLGGDGEVTEPELPSPADAAAQALEGLRDG